MGPCVNLYTLGRPDFWRIRQSPFFGFLEVCMSGPEEDLAQGGRFLMWPERFIIFLNIIFFKNKFLKRSGHIRKRPPWIKSSLGPLVHTPKNPKKVTGEAAKKSGRPYLLPLRKNMDH